jgi:PAS domain S-box-containing protein
MRVSEDPGSKRPMTRGSGTWNRFRRRSGREGALDAVRAHGKPVARDESDATAVFGPLIDAMREAAALLDLDGNILRVNTAFAELFDCGRDAATRRTLRDLVAPTPEPGTSDRMVSALGRGETVSAEAMSVRHDGARILVSVRGTPLRICHDATEPAQDREVRAALHRVNQIAHAHANVIERSLHAVAHEPTLESLSGQLLRTIVTELGADSGAFWQCDEADEQQARIYLAFEDGRIVRGEDSAHPGRELRPIPEELAAQWRLRRFVPVVYQQDDYLRSDTLAFCRDYYEHRDVRTVVTLPLVLGDRLFGTCAVRWAYRRELGDDDLRLATALAMQGAMVLQLVAFARQARTAALAEERERAAQKRAAELSNANRILQDALQLLMSEPDVDAFLAFVLRSVVERFGALSSSLQVQNAERTRIWFHRSWQDGRLQDDDEYGRSPLGQAYEEPSGFDLRRAVYERAEAHFVTDIDTGATLTPALRDALHTLGVKSLANVPLLLGSRVIGRLIIRFDTVRRVGEDDLQLMQSIANQMAIALHMTQLAVEGNHAAVLEERARMARDIHDTLAQGFTGVIVQLEAAKDAIHLHRAADADAHIERASALARDSLAEARRSVHALRPLALEHGSVGAALKKMIETMTAGTGIRARVRTEGNADVIPSGWEDHLLRIGQEAVSNALKHGSPRRVEVLLRLTPAQIVLEAFDDGAGFDPASQPAGMGLTTMRERCAHMGGRFELETAPARGVRIRVMLDPRVRSGAT